MIGNIWNVYENMEIFWMNLRWMMSQF